MNKITFLLALLLITSGVFAQSRIGILGGLNFSDLKTSTETKTRTLMGVGGMFEYSFNENFSLQTEPMYLLKGGKKIGENGDPDITAKLSFVELPIFLKYTFGETIKPYAMTGPAFGLLLTSDIEGEIAGILFKGSIKDITHNFDLGWGFGAGVEIPVSVISVFVESRYTLGLVNLQKGGQFKVTGGGLTITGDMDKEDNRFKTRGIQVFVGMKVPLNNLF